MLWDDDGMDAVTCPRCGESVTDMSTEIPPTVRVDDGVSIRLEREGQIVTLSPCGHVFTSPDLGPALQALYDSSQRLVGLAERS